MKILKVVGHLLITLILAGGVMNAVGQPPRFMPKEMEEVLAGKQMSLEGQLSLGQKRIEQLHSKACQEHPELVRLERELEEVKKIHETEEYKELSQKMEAFLEAIKVASKDEPEVLTVYEVLRHAYIRKWKCKTVPIYYGDKHSRDHFIKTWGPYYSYVDYMERGSVGEQRELIWDEIEKLSTKGLKECMERGFEELEEVQKTYTFPSYVVRYCDLWAEENLTSEALRIVIRLKTSEEYWDYIRWVDWLERRIECNKSGGTCSRASSIPLKTQSVE
jgi:hypothetical protein